MELIESIWDGIQLAARSVQRPVVTVSYAQSLDGSIASRRGTRTQISGSESSRLTHQLRASHDAILIGVGTVLADNPQLSVRFADGIDPQPIILDSHLRTPLDSLLVTQNPPWIVTTNQADPGKAEQLEARGVRLLYLSADPHGRVNLTSLVETLDQESICQLMVEGGSRVLSSFFSHQLVDYMVVTISPLILGGLPAIQFNDGFGSALDNGALPRLKELNVVSAGEDLVVFGQTVQASGKVV